MFANKATTALIALVVVALFSSGPRTFAQTSDGIILGTVSDVTGAVIPNASVTATNKATNVQYKATPTVSANTGSTMFRWALTMWIPLRPG